MTLFSQDPVFARGGVDERVGIFLSSQILWTGSASLLFLPAWFLDTLTQKSGWHLNGDYKEETQLPMSVEEPTTNRLEQRSE